MSSSDVIVVPLSVKEIPEEVSSYTTSAFPVWAAIAIAANGKGVCFEDTVRVADIAATRTRTLGVDGMMSR